MKRIFCFLLLLSLISVSGAVLAQDEPIRVGSKTFTEQQVLGQIIVIALRENNIPVEDLTALGGTVENRQALLSGEIDVYPAYTGTAVVNFFNNLEDVDIPPDGEKDAETAFELASSLDRTYNDLIWLEPAPMNNTYAIAITRELAEENDIFSLEAFAEYVNAGGRVYMAAGDEFVVRPDALPAFEAVYGFDLTPEQLRVIVGGTPVQTEQALIDGTLDINFAMAYTTDGLLTNDDILVLTDDLGAQPVYQPAPVFRSDVLAAYPQIPSILNPIFASIDTATMQRLNARVELDGLDPAEVATEYLIEQGFIEDRDE